MGLQEKEETKMFIIIVFKVGEVTRCFLLIGNT